MSDWCKYPNQCGLGWDCSECMSEELSRRENCIKRLQTRADLAAERERQLEKQVDYLRSANRELVEALKEFRYACTDKAEKMADALTAAYDERNTNEQSPLGD